MRLKAVGIVSTDISVADAGLEHMGILEMCWLQIQLAFIIWSIGTNSGIQPPPQKHHPTQAMPDERPLDPDILS